MIRFLRPLLLLQVTAAFAAGPRLSFTRVVPAPHDLAPAQRVAVIYAIGDNQNITTFVEDFVDYIERAGTLRVENAVENKQNFAAFEGATFKRLRREHPADAYVT